MLSNYLTFRSFVLQYLKEKHPNIIIFVILGGKHCMEKRSKKFVALMSFFPLILIGTITLSGQKEVIKTHAQMGDVVISEVFSAGGEAGGVSHDYVELFNNSSSDIDLTNWSIFYADPAGSFGPMSDQVTYLGGTIKAKSFFLVTGAKGPYGSGMYNLPPADVTGSIQMYWSAFKIALTNSRSIPLNSSSSNVVDFVGASINANDFETSYAPATDLNNSISRREVSGLLIDVNNNAADFKLGHPNPANSSTTLSKTDSEQANELANYVMTGEGLNANGKCSAIKSKIDFVYSRITPSAKTIFDTSTDQVFVDARNRIAYLDSWVSSQPNPSGVASIKQSDLSAVLFIVISSLLGWIVYYTLNRKKHLN